MSNQPTLLKNLLRAAMDVLETEDTEAKKRMDAAVDALIELEEQEEALIASEVETTPPQKPNHSQKTHKKADNSKPTTKPDKVMDGS